MIAKSNILCIFEGVKREVQYFRTIRSLYFDELNFLVCSFGNDIYELYKELKNDDDLDIVELLRESKSAPKNIEILKDYERDDFSQVFLFFDFECHNQNFNEKDFLSIIDLFDEETENGKIFISYPMVEAIRDIPSFDSYLHHKVGINNCSGKVYKSFSLKGLKLFDDPRYNIKEDWDRLIEINVEKANYIIHKTQHEIKTILEQKDIAKKQLESLIKSHDFYVLSAYPLFIYHQKPFTFNSNNE